MRITSAKFSVAKDSVEQIAFSFKSGKCFIDILDDSMIPDFLDMKFVKAILKEELIVGRKERFSFPWAVIIRYKRKPLAEIYPDGRKKMHPLAGIHLGLRLLVQRIVKEL